MNVNVLSPEYNFWEKLTSPFHAEFTWHSVGLRHGHIKVEGGRVVTKHGAGLPFNPLIVPPLADPALPSPDPQNFRHFLRTPGETERYRPLDPLPGEAGESLAARTRHLMQRLAMVITSGRIWRCGLQEGIERWENPSIPSGYTYLAQMVAHDLVQTSLFYPSIDGSAESFRNNRTFKLDLDTLYGGGPAACPHAYAIGGQHDDLFRAQLRLGRMRFKRRSPAGSPKFWNCEAGPLRDIARSAVDGSNDAERHGLTEPMIADPRNDDNSVVSQLLTVFTYLHNVVLAKVQTMLVFRVGQPAEQRLEAQFSATRQLVSRAYRNIVRYDVLKRILHPAIYGVYSDNPSFIDNAGDWRLPLEFSHAAYRFGHAMVRPHYTMNQLATSTHEIQHVLDTTSSVRLSLLPLDQNWIIQWSHFFEVDGRAARNLSRRIGPDLAGSLESTRSPWHPHREEEPTTLAARDLLRGSTIGLWSVPSLIKEIKAKSPTLFDDAPLLSDFATIGAPAIERWLTAHGRDVLTPDEINRLSEDPPLFFFVLFEAAEEVGCKGRHLGTLGSVLVAETLFRLLERHPLQPDDNPQIADLAMQVFQENPMQDMPQMLNFLAEQAGAAVATPPLL